jgi:hypothetical protein
LATLARDHEFTFLDHALKCGDSLVGLTLEQISATHWDTSKPPTFVGKLVQDHLKEAEAKRARIRNHVDDATEAELRPLLRSADAQLEIARRIGDGVVAAFFHADKPKARLARLIEFQKTVQSHLGSSQWIEATAPFVSELRTGEHPIPPFHWPIEFPEVFAEQGGFDAIVGNPPFAGKNTIVAGQRKNYLVWLQTLHEGAHGNSDIVAHFFRRAFGLLQREGDLGLVATNTIGQGDTRASGLAAILAQGGAIFHAQRRLKWPGEAAVVVSVLHVKKGPSVAPVLDGKVVRRISAYIVEGDLDNSPLALNANAKKAFAGSYVLGMGFTFDDATAHKGYALPLSEMNRLIASDPQNRERIFPYIGGEEINSDPRQLHRRYVIDFRQMTEAEARRWPELMSILEDRVRPQRLKQSSIVSPDRWWMHARSASELYSAISGHSRVLVSSRISSHLSFVFIPNGMVYDITVNVFSMTDWASFATLQSRTHQLWARFFASTLEERLRYTPSDCFRTFPFPDGFGRDSMLETLGETYHTFRGNLMIDRDDGLTKTYNRFHDRTESAPDITRLRELHAEIDSAILQAYGWHDLAVRAAPQFIEQGADEGKKPKTRLEWPSEFKDEVLARLLTLNAERAASERVAGLTAAPDEDSGDIDEPENEAA